jgi:hypothetical protein
MNSLSVGKLSNRADGKNGVCNSLPKTIRVVKRQYASPKGGKHLRIRTATTRK